MTANISSGSSSANLSLHGASGSSLAPPFSSSSSYPARLAGFAAFSSSAIRRKNKSAADIVLEAVSAVGPSIVLDYLAELVVLVVGATSGVKGLKEFCALAALVVLLDCVGLFTVYVAVLAIVVEVSSCFVLFCLRCPGNRVAVWPSAPYSPFLFIISPLPAISFDRR
jgi:hypothetical protein